MSQKAGKGISYTISALCGLLDISRQGYYKHQETNAEEDVLISSITYCCRSLRQELPRSGCRELYSLCQSRFGEKFTIGRDRFIDVLRANGMMLRRRRYRPRTTNSDHPYRIYPDLLNTCPKYVASDVCRMMVGDITYISTKEEFAYLSLLTDVFSRIIVGYALFRTLEAEGPAKALMMACGFYKDQGFNLSGLIHHSGRGVQYASKGYVSLLKEREIAISMTQTGDPLHNALAERMNNTVYEVAKTIAKKDKSDIIPSGMTALNELGLSTQIPMRAIYLTNGTPRTIKLGKKTIVFKHSVPKMFSYKSKTFPMVVLALKEIGEENITEEINSSLKEVLSKEKSRIS